MRVAHFWSVLLPRILDSAGVSGIRFDSLVPSSCFVGDDGKLPARLGEDRTQLKRCLSTLHPRGDCRYHPKPNCGFCSKLAPSKRPWGV